DMLLARGENSEFRFYNVSSQINKDKNHYYEILERMQHGNGDITEWLVWYMQKRLQKLQEKITAECLQGFVGKEYDVLIEELVEGEDLAIGRIWAQAPEVDGLTVVMGRDMVPGNVYRCGVTKVNGIDLEAVKL
ncbi:MAG: hypothetical protein II544_00100, partial [Spirochaetales bacterium]|nr:hypothetical protein [Spirochaetales bacterium]